MRFVVTGGAGFIGSHLCDLLIDEGHVVHVLDDLSTGSLGNVSQLEGRLLKMDEGFGEISTPAEPVEVAEVVEDGEPPGS